MFTIAIEMTILYGGLGHGTDTKKKAVCASGCSASFPLSILDTTLVFLISRRYYYYSLSFSRSFPFFFFSSLLIFDSR